MASPRRILVVFAHPLFDSLSASLKDAVTGGLTDGGHDVDLIDLYADDFDPRLSGAERTAFMQPGYTPPPDVAGYCDRIRTADGVVFVFPQWWFGMPAILKGFVDRVVVPGVAFQPGGGRLTPLLENIKTFDVVTTTGSPWWVIELYMRNPVRRQLKQGIASICSKSARFRMLSMYNINKASRADCEKFIARVRRHFTSS